MNVQLFFLTKDVFLAKTVKHVVFFWNINIAWQQGCDSSTDFPWLNPVQFFPYFFIIIYYSQGISGKFLGSWNFQITSMWQGSHTAVYWSTNRATLFFNFYHEKGKLLYSSRLQFKSYKELWLQTLFSFKQPWAF